MASFAGQAFKKGFVDQKASRPFVQRRFFNRQHAIDEIFQARAKIFRTPFGRNGAEKHGVFAEKFSLETHGFKQWKSIFDFRPLFNREARRFWKKQGLGASLGVATQDSGAN